jgi:hypothetical protein
VILKVFITKWRRDNRMLGEEFGSGHNRVAQGLAGVTRKRPGPGRTADFRAYKVGASKVLLLTKHGLQKPGKGGINFEGLDRP